MAGTSAFIWDESFNCVTDLSAKQFYCVYLSSKDTVDVPSAATTRCLGILLNRPAGAAAPSQRQAEVRILGKAKGVSDGSGTAIAVGDYVGPNSSGKLVKKGTADYNVIGIANDVSSADGTIIEVFLLPVNWFRTAAG